MDRLKNTTKIPKMCIAAAERRDWTTERSVWKKFSFFSAFRKQASSLAFSHRGLTLWFQFYTRSLFWCAFWNAGACFSGSDSCCALFEKCQTYANELLCLLNKLLNSQQILEINALSVVRFGRMKICRLINCVVWFPQLHLVAKKEWKISITSLSQFFKKALPNLLIFRFFVLFFLFFWEYQPSLIPYTICTNKKLDLLEGTLKLSLNCLN